jgi:aminomuconate-semialdehyde/2-hydroxymuconate-6-semialdehyde dehydrogenase
MNLIAPKTILNYIDGAFTAPLSNKYMDNINPATGLVYSEIPNSNALDVESAYQAADKAFLNWSQMPKEKRFTILNKIADLIEANLDALALAE